MPRQATRTMRVETRITPETMQAVRRAAEMQGRSVSDFIATAARDAAIQEIQENQVIKLALEDQHALANAILNPPEPGPVWEEAAEAYRRLVKESR
jgi:uncharacterized protein (DUF1778 family)